MVENINTVVGRLRLKQLNLIIAIGQHNSLRKAAAELAMTQSAASKALREAELILGDTLFERRRDGLYANQFGECAINYAHLIRKDVIALSYELTEITTGQGGRIRESSEEHRVGKRVVSLCSSRWSPCNYKKKRTIISRCYIA